MKLRFFLTFIFILALSLALPHVTFAQTTADETEKATPPAAITLTTTPSVTPAATHVEYDLPYPGLLPDNPLYNLKALRDKIIEILISDPAKKGEFYLLSSDKRLNAGNFLIIKGENDLGTLYISKSNNYMSMAIAQSMLAGERGKQDLQKMKLSIQKHEEVITQLQKKVDAKNSAKLSYELGRLKQFALLLLKK
ncbi:MAG: DUF5667 domain-containing protein [Candidatus Levyibacteriota bacterium]